MQVETDLRLQRRLDAAVPSLGVRAHVPVGVHAGRPRPARHRFDDPDRVTGAHEQTPTECLQVRIEGAELAEQHVASSSPRHGHDGGVNDEQGEDPIRGSGGRRPGGLVRQPQVAAEPGDRGAQEALRSKAMLASAGSSVTGWAISATVGPMRSATGANASTSNP